ncbi:hypothetical protein [Vibrio sinaloensis]|uniref:RiboL-PSP-HEPN domain-containing protein n=1 Tax=Photobacterium sp. (strain ATCC 43367) TaxID=379097 RepID=A0A0A5HNA5_PHOS4|nr:hypothetical protein [Vibrio sinaloensis]KGY07007.1 hypothetical protein NM06_19260 [Vibrio sinaloensis]
MSYSFDIKDSKDLFHEFSRLVGEYRKDPLSSGSAVICAIFSWHVVEWIYQEYPSLTATYPKKRDFQDFMKSSCPALSYMQDVANGSKHRGITMYQPVVKKTERHQGAFSSAFSKDFDVSSLKIELDGGVAYFDEEVDKVEAYIKHFFSNTLKENV